MQDPPTAADLAARFPAFAAVPSSALDTALGEAQARVDGRWIDGDRAIGVMLLAAHTLTLDGYGGGAEAALAAAGAQDVRLLRSEALTLARDVPVAGRGSGSGLETTSYGRRFLALLRVNQPAVLVP